MTGPFRPATAADPKEAETLLAAHPEIEAIDLVLVDIHGIGRGKIIRRHELPALYTQGRPLAGSILGLDITGEDVEATGLVYADGDADRRGWPVPGTLVPLSWTTPPRAQVLIACHELDGSPMPVDPRHALRRRLAALAERGLTPVGAFELEFYLLEQEPDGRLAPARLKDGRRPDTINCYGLDELDGLQPLFADIYTAAAAQGLEVETAISEYAIGQYELTLHYRRDLERACDDLVMLKRLVRGVAARHGKLACFMAKPFTGAAGCGMHLHLSLADTENRNVFAETPEAPNGLPAPADLTPLLRHAIGGLLAGMGEAMLAFAPHLNSWRRLAGGTYAPTKPNWGINNRTVAVRVPAGAAAARRLELRPAGVDANPFMVATAALGAIERGLAEARDPGPAITGNGYETPLPEGAPAIPGDFAAAIRTAARSAALKEALGDRLHAVFVTLSEAELHKVTAEVTDTDRRLYLHTV